MSRIDDIKALPKFISLGAKKVPIKEMKLADVRNLGIQYTHSNSPHLRAVGVLLLRVDELIREEAEK